MDKFAYTYRVADLALTPEGERAARRDEAEKLITELKEKTSALGWPLFVAERESRPGTDDVWRAFHADAERPPPALILVKRIEDDRDAAAKAYQAATSWDLAELYALHLAFPAAWVVTAPLISATFVDRLAEFAGDVKNKVEEIPKTIGNFVVGALITVGAIGALAWVAKRRMRR